MVKRALVATLLLASCFKGGGSSTPKPDPVGNQVPVKGGPDYSATIADAVGFLPVDSEIVLGLDVDALRKSPLWPPLAAKLAGVGGNDLDMFKRVCGFDPMTTIHAISLGMKNLKASNPDGVIVVHGLDRPQLTSCMTRAAGKGDKAVVIEDGIVSISGTVDAGVANKVSFAFVDASTVVAVIGPSSSKAQLQAVLAGGAPLRSSPAFNQLAALTNLEASMWGVMNGSSSIFDAAAGMGMRPKAIVGSIEIVTGMVAALRVRLDTPAAAQQIQQMANGQIGMIRAMFDKLDITTDAQDLVINATMNDQQLQSMIQLALGSGGP